MLCKVEKGQDPYTVIGNYISDHMKYLEDMIATISIDGKTTNELLMVDVNEPGYFVWESDWWEGEDDIGLVDFFSVSDACNPREIEEREGEWVCFGMNKLCCFDCGEIAFERKNYCANCGRKMRKEVRFFKCIDCNKIFALTDTCPNCGADMRGGENG